VRGALAQVGLAHHLHAEREGSAVYPAGPNERVILRPLASRRQQARSPGCSIDRSCGMSVTGRPWGRGEVRRHRSRGCERPVCGGRV